MLYTQGSTYAGSSRVQGTVPKRIGGLPCRDASMSCDDSCFSILLSLKDTKIGQLILRTHVSRVVRLHGLWVLAVVCGLSAPIVGPFGFNVVLRRFLFAPIVG